MNPTSENIIQAIDDNPYQPPVADVRDLTIESAAQQLAGRGLRLVAVIIDSLVYSFAAAMAAVTAGIGAGAAISWENFGMLVYAATTLLLLGINLYLLHRNGQTIGKLALNIKIVRADGGRAGLARLFLVRSVLTWALYSIPLLNLVFFPLDALFIFRNDRRCLHDLIAGTKVINA